MKMNYHDIYNWLEGRCEPCGVYRNSNLFTYGKAELEEYEKSRQRGYELIAEIRDWLDYRNECYAALMKTQEDVKP